MRDQRGSKNVDISLPQFSLKTPKKQLLKALFTCLVHISSYFLPQLLRFADISSTCNSPTFHLSKITFLIPLLLSNSEQIHMGIEKVWTGKIGMSQTQIYSFGISTHWILSWSFIKHQSTTLKAQANQIYQRKNLFSFLPMTKLLNTFPFAWLKSVQLTCCRFHVFFSKTTISRHNKACEGTMRYLNFSLILMLELIIYKKQEKPPASNLCD